MDLDAAREFLRRSHRAVLATYRRDGRPQLSPVLVGLDEAGRVVVSSTEDRVKVLNLRRDPRVAVCAFSDSFYGPWVQVEGEAEIISLPAAMAGLIEYYRGISGEHPDWDEYRQAMRAERRVLIRFAITRASGADG